MASTHSLHIDARIFESEFQAKNVDIQASFTSMIYSVMWAHSPLSPWSQQNTKMCPLRFPWLPAVGQADHSYPAHTLYAGKNDIKFQKITCIYASRASFQRFRADHAIIYSPKSKLYITYVLSMSSSWISFGLSGPLNSGWSRSVRRTSLSNGRDYDYE